MVTVTFDHYEPSQSYGVITIYSLSEDGKVGEAWVEPTAYLCGHYTPPELVIHLRGEVIRVPRPEVGDVLQSPIKEIWAGMHECVC
jgi:hypothetical protein